MTTLLALRERAGMDHVDVVVLVENEYDLKKPSATSPPPDEPLVVGTPLREGLPRTSNHGLRFVTRDAMRADVLRVPGVPAEMHTGI